MYSGRASKHTNKAFYKETQSIHRQNSVNKKSVLFEASLFSKIRFMVNTIKINKGT